MKQDRLYDNIKASISKLAVDFITNVAPTATYVDFDAHASQTDLPPGLIVGPAGCGLTEDDTKIEIIFGLGVATNNDPGLYVLTQTISKLRAIVIPKTRITIYDHAPATPWSWMVVVTPQAITPVSRAEVRAMQFIECKALLDLRAVTLS